MAKRTKDEQPQSNLQRALYSPLACAKRELTARLNDAKHKKSYARQFGDQREGDTQKLIAVAMYAGLQKLKSFSYE